MKLRDAWRSAGGSLRPANGRSGRRSRHSGACRLQRLEQTGRPAGVPEDDPLALIDWQMTMLGPVAIELGWLLVGNSGVLADRPEVVLEAYRRAVEAVGRSALVVGSPFDPGRSAAGARASMPGRGRSSPRVSAARTISTCGAPVRSRQPSAGCSPGQLGAARSRRGNTKSAVMTATNVTVARTTRSLRSGSPLRIAFGSR